MPSSASGITGPTAPGVLGSTASGVLGSTASGVVSASGGVGLGDPRVQAMVNEANSLVGKPYVYGGGHSGWGPQTGYDCSGFVSAVLHAGGYLTSPVDTTALPSQPGMVSGPGQYVTVYDRALPGQSGHVIIEINGQFYESGGMHGAWGAAGARRRSAPRRPPTSPPSRPFCTPKVSDRRRRIVDRSARHGHPPAAGGAGTRLAMGSSPDDLASTAHESSEVRGARPRGAQ